MKTISSLAFLVSLVALLPSIAAADDKGFTKIFDGKSLDGWEGQKGLWSVEEGAITGQTSAKSPLKKNTFLIWRKAELKDFTLKLKFRLVSEKGNSGIQFRSKELDDFVVSGYQADIDSKPHRFMGILYEERGRGILAERSSKVVISERGEKKKAGATLDEKKFMSAIKEGGWNDYVITVKGNHIVQQINGFTTVDVTDNQYSRAAKQGILALQLHQGPPMKIQFKDILLRSK
jgi:hypothetical protein